MHLLDVETRRLKKYVEEKNGKAVEEYAILSHRWLARDDEVLFQDIESNDHTLLEKKRGFYKLIQCCKEARRNNLKYVWIDTCCIDQSNSAELQESINSMYRYYANANECYVYLKDTSRTIDGRFKIGEEEDWFERVWTLQELIAPKIVYFFDTNWYYLGDKKDLCYPITERTGIHEYILRGKQNLDYFSVAQRMSWASGRKTTKDEDIAYSLLGLFDVNMPMLYGEGGAKAFRRLQEEITKTSDDHSIFAWGGVQEPCGLLATSPESFRNCGKVKKTEDRVGSSPFSMTNRGLSITLNMTPWTLDTYMASINCTGLPHDRSNARPQLGIFVCRLAANDQYSRVRVDGKEFYYHDRAAYDLENQHRHSRNVSIFVTQPRLSTYDGRMLNGFRLSDNLYISSLERGHRGPQERVLTFSPGKNEWHDVGTLKLSNHGKIKKIKMGFDFGFNPTILLCESTIDPTIDFFNASLTTDEPRGAVSVWHRSPGVPLEWNRIERTGTGLDIASTNPYHGLWVLKGDRIYGLNVRLGSSNIWVFITREERWDSGSLGWCLDIII
ncbi:HET-domain-containing protein [Annulohypoxylon bovei var. microspora]|nr:HET-domain-containing protein [Annulohypoxylon bovei var. microspora]